MNHHILQKRQPLFFFIITTILGLFLIFMTGLTACASTAFLLSAEVTDSPGVLLTWQSWQSDSMNATYQIERSTQPESGFSIVATLSGQTGVISCHDNSVSFGETYYYKITKLLDNQPVTSSNVVKITVTLARPQNLKAAITQKATVKLTWQKIESAEGYEIYRSTKANGGFQKIGKTSKNKFTDTTVKPGSVYYYEVTAIRTKGQSCSSQPSDIAVACMEPAAPVVTGFYVKKKIKLTWKKVKGADTYYVYKKNADGDFVKIGSTSKLYYMDKDVKKGKIYEYKISAGYKKNGKTIEGELSCGHTITASGIDPNKKMVALTYDDGPGPYTTAIVNCLTENNGKATFFVVGSRVSSYKKQLKAINKAGCEIANHSYDHANFSKLSADKISQEIADTDKKIKDITGQSTKLVRTPGGATSDTIKKAVKKPIILWSIDTLDWKTRSCDKTVDAVMNHVKDGDIILMHDIHESTKNASLIIIPQLRKMGYQLVTVSELANYRGYQLEKGTVYRHLRNKKQ